MLRLPNFFFLHHRFEQPTTSPPSELQDHRNPLQTSSKTPFLFPLQFSAKKPPETHLFSPPVTTRHHHKLEPPSSGKEHPMYSSPPPFPLTILLYLQVFSESLNSSENEQTRTTKISKSAWIFYFSGKLR